VTSMNRDDGHAPGAQRSVAELLAAYGAEPRRDGATRSDPDARRHRAAVSTDTPPHAARSSSPKPAPARSSPDRPFDGDGRGGGPSYGMSPFGDGPARGTTTGRSSSYGPPVGGPGPNGTAGASSASAAQASSTTEAFPACLPGQAPDGGGDGWSRPATAPDPRERPAAEGYRTSNDDETGALPTGGPIGEPPHPALRGGTAMMRRSDAPAGQAHTDEDDDEVAGYSDDDYYRDDYDDEDDLADEEDARPGMREWVAVAVQVVLGAILGALLWVGFSYLWKYLPPVALVLALVSTTGLVFGVRAMRRSDDLKTTVLAVVVGLLVTVSPAVLVLLVGTQG